MNRVNVYFRLKVRSWFVGNILLVLYDMDVIKNFFIFHEADVFQSFQNL